MALINNNNANNNILGGINQPGFRALGIGALNNN